MVRAGAAARACWRRPDAWVVTHELVCASRVENGH